MQNHSIWEHIVYSLFDTNVGVENRMFVMLYTRKNN